jgi:hypothetical protein
MQFCLRAYRSEDLPFVNDAFVKSSRMVLPWCAIDRELWSNCIRPRLANLLTRALVLVCCDPEAPNVIWGFAIYEPGMLHFVYTKFALRRNGIAKALVAKALEGNVGPVTLTVLENPDLLASLVDGHETIYNPFLGVLA